MELLTERHADAIAGVRPVSLKMYDKFGSHGVFDPRPWDTQVEAVPHFVLIVPLQLLTQESGHGLGFDRMDGGAGQVLIEGLQVCLATEDDIGRLLALIQAPVVGGS
jgi:hypothetical protein